MGGTVTIFDPQGNKGDIPHESLAAAVKAGAKPAVTIKDPQGNLGEIPADQMQAASKAGATIVPYHDQETQHPEFWHQLYSDALGIGKGVLSGAGTALRTLSGDPTAAQDMMKSTAQVLDSDPERKAAGYSQTYRAVAPLGGLAGVDVPTMEKHAAHGDVSAVAADTVAPMGALGATLAAAHTVPTLKEAVPGAIEATSDAAKSIAAKTPVLKAFVDGPPEQLMMKAIKPRSSNTGFNDAVKGALPNMKAAEADLGHPVQGVDDALQVADIAKKKIWQRYQEVLGPAAARGVQLDGNSIADAMMRSIDKRTATQNPGLVDKVQQVADTYRRPMNVAEAEDYLQSANKELTSYYAKNKVGRSAALADPSVAYTVAESDALRDSLYSKLNEASGPGAADLKRAYGAITNVQGELLNRQNVAARQQPQSLNEQISTARGAGKIVKGVFTASPGDILEGAEGIATSKWMKERNSTDAMISRAFEATEPAKAPPGGPRPMFIKGLLNRGPVPLGSSPDTSGSVPFTPPPVDATTRAQRLGLLLPERTATELPPSTAAEPMQVQRAQSRVIRDPRTGQMRRQYLPIGQ